MFIKKYTKIYFFIITVLLIYMLVDTCIIYIDSKLDMIPQNTKIDSNDSLQIIKPKMSLSSYLTTVDKRDIWVGAYNRKQDIDMDTDQLKEKTKLNLKLIGTIIGSKDTSCALIEDMNNHDQDLYKINDRIKNYNATIKDIRRNLVVLLNNGREEILVGFKEEENNKKSTSKQRSIKKRKPSNNDIGKRVAPNKWEIDRTDVDQLMNSSMSLLKQIRIVPHMDNEGTNGFQVQNINPGSVFEKLGIKKGDIIHDINGHQINTAEAAFEAYQKLKSEPNVTIGIERGGQTLDLNYDIKD